MAAHRTGLLRPLTLFGITVALVLLCHVIPADEAFAVHGEPPNHSGEPPKDRFSNTKAESEYSLWKVDTFEAKPDIAVGSYESTHRPETSLDGIWQVKMDPGQRGFAEKWFSREDVEFEHALRVPGNWNAQGLGGPGPIKQEKRMLFGELGMRLTAKFKGSYHGLAWYRKRVDVPADWAGRRIRLVFGGLLNSVRLWVNGQFVGGRWTDGNSFYFDVTQQIRFGQANTVVLAIDNRWKEAATISHFHWYVPIGGPFHHIVLRALPMIHIKSAIVRPELDGPAGSGIAQVHVSVTNLSDSEEEVSVSVEIASLQALSTTFCGSTRLRVGSQRTDTAVLPIKIAPVRLWSCDQPSLYRLQVHLEFRNGEDTVVDRFGMRTVSSVGNRFEMNERPVFIRGQHFHFFWHNTLTPPITKEEYARILRLFKAYGFNYLLAPWLMPEECYQAADEVGMMLQLEFPYAFEPYAKIKRQLIKRLIEECLEAYANHPSLVVLCMSNEESWDKQGRLNYEFCTFSKSLDPTRLVIDTDGRPEIRLKESMISDILAPMNHSSDWQVYMQNVARQREEYSVRPTIDHEFLNVPTLANVASFKLYTGPIAALPKQMLQALPRRLREQGMEEDYDRYLKASYLHQANFIKEGMERTRKNPLKAGFSMCAWNDIEVGIHWGILDAFMNAKAISPQQMRAYNARDVVLMDSVDPSTREIELLTDYCRYCDEPFEIQPYVSYFGHQPVTGATVTSELCGPNGEILAGGEVQDCCLCMYAVTALPRICIRPTNLSNPLRATLKLRLSSPKVALENTWPIWLFPRIDRENVARTIVASNSLLDELTRVASGVVGTDKRSADSDNTLWVTDEGETALEWLSAGKTVLFIAKGGATVGSKSPFDPGWFRGDQHMGSVLRPHRLLGHFPHEGFASWQFRHLINRVKTIPEGRIGAKPVISSVFNSTMPRVQHQLFVANTNTGGHLTYCILKVLSGRCEADYLLWQLLKNTKRDATDPVLTVEQAAKYLVAR